jgi:hypothetical protein
VSPATESMGPDHDADTTRYFELIVQCAKAAASDREDEVEPAEYWSWRIHREWLHVNRVLEEKPPVPIRRDPALTAGYYAAALGRLAREVLMAAWAMGTWPKHGTDDPEYAEHDMVQTTKALDE